MKKKKPIKRKPRKKMAKNPKLNLLYPIDILEMGSENDPCFGKHHDPKAPECRECGDCEFCQIVMAQNNHLLREKEEKKGSFKDMEEKAIYESKEEKSELPIKEIKKFIRNTIRKIGDITIKQLTITVVNRYPDLPKARAERLIKSVAEKAEKIIVKKSTLIWKN